MNRQSLRCLLFGHRLHVDAWHFYGIAQCEDCGREFYEVGWIARARVRVAICARWVCERASGLWALLFCRCPECGQRFGRHDNTIDHLPF